MKVSVLFGNQVSSIEPLVSYADVCRSNGTRLWLGQSLIVESHVAFGALAGRGLSVDMGMCVAIAPLRTPYDAYLHAQSVVTLMGRPLSVAFGMGTPDFAAQLLGRPLTRPGTYTAEYIQNVIRERESQKGIFFTESIDRAVDDVVTGVEIGAGVLRQGMARKAGAFAEFIVTWLTPREYLRDVIIPSLKVGAEQAGRAAPRVVSVVPFALNRNGRDVLRLMVRSVSHHIKFPHYQAMMNEAGVAMVGNLGADLRAALSSQLFAYGSADDLVSTLREYERIGVDEVILNPASLALREGHAAAIQDLKEAFEIVGSSLAG